MNFLQSTYRHPPRDQCLRQQFTDAQIEMWTLAQAISTILNPDLQWNIDTLRAKLVKQLKATADLPPGIATGFVMRRAAKGKTRPLLWQDIEITPEISCDPTLTGSAALGQDVVLLRRLLREQRVLVSRSITTSELTG